MTIETIDLEEELPRRERRRLVTPAGVVAAVVAIAAIGFLGGVQVQKSRGSTGGGAGAMARGGFPGTAGGGPGGAGQQQGGDGQSDATTGEVASVDGSTIYVEDSSGNTIRVKLGKGGEVTRTAVTEASDIHPGDTVVIQGETRSSGTLVASTIRATASNAGSAGLGGFGAAPGGG